MLVAGLWETVLGRSATFAQKDTTMSAHTTLAKATGKRLYLTRSAIGIMEGGEALRQEDFAAAAGMARTTYNQYENGARLLPPERAIDICNAYVRHGLTLDWLYRGDTDGLRARIASMFSAIDIDQ
ncbi:MAG: helix-turn-helix transcriptional regulator [Pseudomonadota bacterium]